MKLPSLLLFVFLVLYGYVTLLYNADPSAATSFYEYVDPSEGKPSDASFVSIPSTLTVKGFHRLVECNGVDAFASVDVAQSTTSPSPTESLEDASKTEKEGDVQPTASEMPLPVFDATNAEENAYEILKKYNGELLVCLSGHNWVDLMNIGVNKGEAIKIIQENYNISFDETMAFGDYLNDFEMMQNCKYSYAMENAHPKLKEICNYRAKSNDEDGVVDAIKKHFEL